MENNSVKEMAKGDFDKKPLLPEPNVVLFPPEQIQLGWQNKELLAGSGLVNTGVICYINATLQALFHIPCFANWLMSDEEHLNACQQKANSSEFQNKCMICMMRDTFMLSQWFTGSSFKASFIIDCLSQIHKYLSTQRQEDAHEFLCYLIESMERSYLSVSGYADKSLDAYSKQTTPLNQIFGGYMRTEVTCEECGCRSTTFQHFQNLTLDIDRSDNVRDALNNHFEGEQLSYVCGRCRKEVLAEKKCSIEKAPNVLCVQLRRFEMMMDGSICRKNRKIVQINESVDLANCVFGTDERPLRYRLVSMVIHHGPHLNSGHYTAVGVTPSGPYYFFNDSNVCQTRYEQFSKCNNLYIIFYELDPLENANNAGAESEPSTSNADPLTQVPEKDGSKIETASGGTIIGNDVDVAVSTPVVVDSMDQQLAGGKHVAASPAEDLSAARQEMSIPKTYSVHKGDGDKFFENSDRESEPSTSNVDPLTKVPKKDGSKIETASDATINGNDVNVAISTPAVVDSTDQQLADKKRVAASPTEDLPAAKRKILMPKTHSIHKDDVKPRNDMRNDFVDLKANDQHRNSPVKRSIDDDFDREIVKRKRYDNYPKVNGLQTLLHDLVNQYVGITNMVTMSENTLKRNADSYKRYYKNNFCLDNNGDSECRKHAYTNRSRRWHYQC